MRKLMAISAAFFCVMMLLSISLIAQSNCSPMLQANTMATVAHGDMSVFSGLMELPFLMISIFFAFATANALKGGTFGNGMNLIAWGFVVMAIGHLHMQAEHLYGFHLFKYLFGESIGSLAWYLALVVTWGFSGLGFYSMLKASKGQ
jgi:hypothetical protein